MNLACCRRSLVRIHCGCCGQPAASHSYVSGRPKSKQNRSPIPLWMPRGGQEHRPGISGASWERPDTFPARPRGTQETSRAPKDARTRARARPGGCRGGRRRRQEARTEKDSDRTSKMNGKNKKDPDPTSPPCCKTHMIVRVPVGPSLFFAPANGLLYY